MIEKKSGAELALYRETGRIAAQVLTELAASVAPGVSTLELARIAEDLIVGKHGAVASSIGQYGFKFALNSSPNEVVCHGVPSASVVLRAGDILNLDVTVKKHGFIADTSRMYLVGPVAPEARRLCDVTYECLLKGIAQVRPGNTTGDIGFAVHRHALKHGYAVVREYCGHGVGRRMHEEPQIAHYGTKGKGVRLEEGMTFTIEPMINQGSGKILQLDDGWTVVTRDGKLSAQWEHTVAVTASGFEVLTLRDEEREPGSKLRELLKIP